MNRFVKVSAIVAILGACGLAVAMSRVMTTKQIMARLNKGPAALTPLLKRELQASQPEWGEIQNQTREYVKLATDLGKADPPKGNAGSWAKLTREYAAIALALDSAAQKHDKSAALAAHGRLTRSCAACHRAHRE